MKKVVLKQFLIIALITISGFAYSQDVLLKYNFEKGKTYILSSQLSNNVTQSMGGQEIKVETGILANRELLIEGLDNSGNFIAIETLKNASISTKFPAMNQDTTMNFANLDEQSKVVLSSLGKEIARSSITPVKIFSTFESVKQYIRLQCLPGKLVKVGEKWTEKMVDSIKANPQSPAEMIYTTEIEYTLVGKEVKDGKEYFKISFSAAITITGKGSMQGMEVFFEGTGKTEGFSYFNPSVSLIENTEANTELDMSIAVTGQQNMTMPMSQSIKTVIKLEVKR